MFVNRCISIIIFFNSAVACFITTGHAQSINIDQKISVTTGNRSVSELFSELSRKTGIRFSFKPSEMNTSKMVLISESPQSLRNILEQILKTTNLAYRVVGQHIIFYPGPKIIPKSIKLTQSRPPAKVQKTLVSPDIVSRVKPIPNVVDNFDSSIRVKMPARKFIGFRMGISRDPPAPIKEAGDFPWHLKGGFRIDDLFYSGLETHAGIRPLHAIVSWVTDYRVGGFRVGVGGSAWLSNEWRISGSATWGRLSRKFNVDTFVNRKITVRGELYRAGITFEKMFGQKFSIEFGPVWNLLHTSYFFNGNRQALSGVPGIRRDVDEYYRPVKPLYLFRNTYESSNANNKKMWIGFQAAVFYRVLK